MYWQWDCSARLWTFQPDAVEEPSDSQTTFELVSASADSDSMQTDDESATTFVIRSKSIADRADSKSQTAAASSASTAAAPNLLSSEGSGRASSFNSAHAASAPSRGARGSDGYMSDEE